MGEKKISGFVEFGQQRHDAKRQYDEPVLNKIKQLMASTDRVVKMYFALIHLNPTI